MVFSDLWIGVSSFQPYYCDLLSAFEELYIDNLDLLINSKINLCLVEIKSSCNFIKELDVKFARNLLKYYKFLNFTFIGTLKTSCVTGKYFFIFFVFFTKVDTGTDVF